MEQETPKCEESCCVLILSEGKTRYVGEKREVGVLRLRG